ncbi:MAG TPA: 16S rRNA (uracil(1498)-N(3))-methyltransferase [Vicinamibacterales bacterium]|nr:16S rRNA (uracil(1498)-N(3))-methyltransferase [Vicinamibacterales bacterium]
MHRFHTPDWRADGARVQLPDDEAQHLARVLRLKTGDTVAVFDGKGREALAVVESVASRRVMVKILEPRTPAPESAVAITLAQALLKSDKMDRVIRDAVMLGVSAIQPFVSRRTDVPRAALKTGVRQDRWDRTVVSSAKQCGRAVVPRVFETHDFAELLASTSAQMRVMFVEPAVAGEAVVPDVSSLEGQRPTEAMVLIGPEGGWEPDEVRGASAAGVTLVTLGSRVLRADAAGAAALAVLRYIWRDL